MRVKEERAKSPGTLFLIEGIRDTSQFPDTKTHIQQHFAMPVSPVSLHQDSNIMLQIGNNRVLVLFDEEDRVRDIFLPFTSLKYLSFPIGSLGHSKGMDQIKGTVLIKYYNNEKPK